MLNYQRVHPWNFSWWSTLVNLLQRRQMGSHSWLLHLLQRRIKMDGLTISFLEKVLADLVLRVILGQNYQPPNWYLNNVEYVLYFNATPNHQPFLGQQIDLTRTLLVRFAGQKLSSFRRGATWPKEWHLVGRCTSVHFRRTVQSWLGSGLFRWESVMIWTYLDRLKEAINCLWKSS